MNIQEELVKIDSLLSQIYTKGDDSINLIRARMLLNTIFESLKIQNSNYQEDKKE